MSETLTADVGLSAGEKIGLPNYSNCEVNAWITIKAVPFDKTADLDATLKEAGKVVEAFIAEFREDILKMVQSKS